LEKLPELFEKLPELFGKLPELFGKLPELFEKRAELCRTSILGWKTPILRIGKNLNSFLLCQGKGYN
jgi:hypothetical protein